LFENVFQGITVNMDFHNIVLVLFNLNFTGCGDKGWHICSSFLHSWLI